MTNKILTLVTVSLLSLTVIACNKPAEDPKAVADKYWQLLQAGNTAEAEKLVTTNSKRVFADHTNRINAMDNLENGEAKTIVNTSITRTDPNSNYSQKQTFNTVLVLEQGQWKVDVEQTHIPLSTTEKEQKLQQLSDELSKSMKQNVESIDEAMNHGIQMLNEALQDGSQEMGESLLEMMNELNNTMHQSIDKLKQRREQQLQEQQQKKPEQPQQPNKPEPNPAKGEGMI
jgi:flagellar biosynthesis/type III secretory pathway protein FliH